MNMPTSLAIPERIWIEMHDTAEGDSCDVIVEMEDGAYYTAMFVTMPYLERQMELSYQIGKNLTDVPAVRYAAFETPQIIVPDLELETIEDVIDNLLSLDTFCSIFTKVTEDETEDEQDAPQASRKRATAEVAAVVVTEVLRLTDPTTVA
ncbi:MAG: hypothetical protein CUN53_01885 [Phototrophicales bacterium]|nr:MAG: hypothetical protein CUN53_01885 [Phototrophicales bacterium]